MKVILISQDFYPLRGGIARYLLQIYENYFKESDFKAIVPKNISKKSDYNNFKFLVHRFVFTPFKTFDKRKNENRKLLAFLEKEKPDLILFGYLRSHPEVAEEYKKINPNCKYGIILHAKEAFFDSSKTKKTNNKGVQKGYSLNEILDYKNILNKADFLITVSNFTKKLIKNQKIKNKFFVINPLLTKIPHEIKEKDRKNFNILSVGRLIKRKGHDEVIKVLKEVRNKIPDITYTLVGDGPEKESLKTLALELGVSQNVIFEDNVSDKKLNNYYGDCDVFILPNKFILPNDIEGFGIVFLEANSYGKPVIGGKNGGVMEAIQNKKSGFLINPLNRKELFDKILFLYNNPNTRKKMGTNGRYRVIEKFYKNKNKDFLEYLNEIKKLSGQNS